MPMSRKSFVENATPLTVVINGISLSADPKEFKTGSVGWNINGKMNVKLPSGEVVTCQVGLNLTVAHSKDWPAESGKAVAAAV